MMVSLHCTRCGKGLRPQVDSPRGENARKYCRLCCPADTRRNNELYRQRLAEEKQQLAAVTPAQVQGVFDLQHMTPEQIVRAFARWRAGLCEFVRGGVPRCHGKHELHSRKRSHDN